MKRLIVTLGTEEIVEGINANQTLKNFRAALKKKGYTEINTVYKNGKHIVEFITKEMKRIELIDAGLIKGTKEEQKEYSLKTKDTYTKKSNLGYAW